MESQHAAAFAAFDVAAEPLGATRLNRAHGPVLHRGKPVCGAKPCAVARKNLGEFYLRTCRIRVVRMRSHWLPALGVSQLQQVQRCGGARQVLLRQMQVACRGADVAVAQ